MSKTLKCNVCGDRYCTYTTNRKLSTGWTALWCPLASTEEVSALPAEWEESKPRGG